MNFPNLFLNEIILVHRHLAQLLRRHTYHQRQILQESSPLPPPAPSFWAGPLDGNLQEVLPELVAGEPQLSLPSGSYQAIPNQFTGYCGK